MIYKTDTFNFRRRALIECRAPLDFSYETSCEGLAISGTQDLNQNRRVIFRIGDEYFKFGNSGLISYTRHVNAADVLQYGNTVAELLNADCTPFVGKLVYPIIALEADVADPIQPKIKIAAKVKNYNDVYTRFEYSPVYTLTGNAKIANISYDNNCVNNGIATLTCRIKKVTGWSDWLYPSELTYQNAQAIQFRIQYILSAIDGSDVANLANVKCRYVTESDLATGDSSELVTKYVDFDADFKTCYARVKHGGNCRAFITFGDAPVKREGVQVGNYLIYNGVVDKNVAPDSIKIQIGDKPVYDFAGKMADFDFDTADSTINVDTTETVRADWIANYPAETWLEMELDTFKDNVSRFTHRINGAAKVSAVKFVYDDWIDGYIVGWKG